jgi:Na+/H+-dicarboxylate symporter
MSETLVSLGLEKPKKLGFKELCITAVWATLALFVGLSVATSVQAADDLNSAASMTQSQGL